MIKLLKYEFKQTWRMCLTLLSITLLSCIALMINPFNIFSVKYYLYIGVCLIVVIGASLSLFIYCMVSFNQEFVRPQGYLIMTLPIKVRDFIWAKFIAQGIWNGLCALVVLLCIPPILNRYINIGAHYNLVVMPTYVELIANGISTYILNVLVIYFSIVILSMQPRHNYYIFIKIILSATLVNVMGLFTGVISMLVPYAFKNGFPKQLADISKMLNYIENNMQNIYQINTVINIIVACIFYLGIKWIIEKKVQI